MVTSEGLKKATEGMKTIKIHNKNYPPVTERVRAFRSVCPSGSIETRPIPELTNEKVITMQTTIKDEAGNILSTGIAQEVQGSSNINKTSYIENCETSAVGRALAFLGIGVDESMASAEEVANAVMNQERITDKEKKVLENLVEKKGIDIKQLFPYGIDLTAEQYKKAMDWLGTQKDKE